MSQADNLPRADNMLLPFALKAAWLYKGSLMFIALCVGTFSYMLSDAFNDQPQRVFVWDTFRLASGASHADLSKQIEDFAASTRYKKFHHRDSSPMADKVDGFLFVYRPGGTSAVVAWMDNLDELRTFQRRMSADVAPLEGGRTVRTAVYGGQSLNALTAAIFGLALGLAYAMFAAWRRDGRLRLRYPADMVGPT